MPSCFQYQQILFQKYDIDPAVVLPAVVEPPSEEAFLTKHPRDYDILLSAAVPVIIGILSGDGIVKSGRKDLN